MEAQQAIHCPHVAWWMHYQISLLEGYHLRLPRKQRPREPALQRLLQQGHPQGSTWLERCRLQGCSSRYPNPRFLHCLELVRRLPYQGSPSQPAPSPERLLRCSHIQDQARVCQRQVQGRREHSRELDWKGRKCQCFNVPSISLTCDSNAKMCI
jgi:hypothetical protein